MTMTHPDAILAHRVDWPLVKFGDVVKNVKAKVDRDNNPFDRYIAGDHMDSEDLQLRRWGEFGQDYVGPAFHRVFRKGQVLYGSRRTYLKKVAVAPFDGVCANTTFVLETKDQSVFMQELLPFLMLSDTFTEHSVSESKGSVNPYINWPDIAKYEFPLPPLDEQKRLAELLWAAEEAVRGFDDAIQWAQELRTATLLSLYEKGIRSARMRKTNLGNRPEHWEIAPLSTHFEVQLGKMMSKKAKDGQHHRPYIRNANVQWNHLDLTDVATMSFSPHEVAKFELRYGDILACEGRHVGKAAIWRDELPGACYQKALHRLRPLDDEQVPEFFLYHMEYSSRRGIFADCTSETTIPHLPAEVLRRIHFAFPPKEEQRLIAGEIEKIDDVVAGAKRHRDLVRRVQTRLAAS